MSYHSHRILSPGASRKRKEREPFYPSTSPKPLVPLTSVTRPVSGTNPKPNAHGTTSFNRAEPQPMASNRLLAGCMAYEFLTKGTLLGQKYDPARAEAVPVGSAESKRKLSVEAEPIGKPKPKPESYAEVANVLKSDGAHVPGVVNPSQLARWIQM